MTDAEIKKALEKAINEFAAEDVGTPKYFKLVIAILDLFNRQQAEIEELTHKLECLLCHATGSKLSKSTYSLRTMELAVNDEVQECCEEAKAEALKEYKNKVENDIIILLGKSNCTEFIECLDYRYKEMAGDAE